MINLYKEEFSIRNSDFSYNDEIKPQSILEILEEIAARHASKLNIGYDALKEKGLAWVCVRTKVKILSNLEYGKNSIVETYPIKCGKIDFDRNYIIKDLKGNDCVCATTKWILIDYNTRRIQRSSVIDYPLDLNDTNLLDVSKKIVSKDINLTNKSSFKVSLNDLDHNGHMNNAKYVEHIFNTFNKFNLDSFEIEYIKELKYNEDAYILYDNDNSCYNIYNSNNELSCVVNVYWR